MNRLTLRTAVIVDEHPLWLDAVEALLDRLEVKVVGRTTDGSAAADLVTKLSPDMFLAELRAIEHDRDAGARVIGCVRAAEPGVKVIVLADTDDAVTRAFGAGVDVFCTKRAQPDDLLVAVHQVFHPSIYFAASAPPLTVFDVDATAVSEAEDQSVALTKREIEILRLVAEGHSNAALARMLWVTEQTVKFHLSNVYRKLGVANRTEASRWAQQRGLLEETAAA
jgi:DNA-binding NarL/FixJ family response regulator